MAKIIINVDWVPDNFGAAPANEDIACVATGKTLEDVEKNIVAALRFHLEGMQEDGETIPEEFLGAWEPEFRLSTRAMLKYSDKSIKEIVYDLHFPNQSVFYKFFKAHTGMTPSEFRIRKA